MDYQIKNHEWERIVCILSAIQGIKTKNELKLRRFIEAIWFIARTGCQWRLLPLTYSAWRSVHQRFMRWNRKNIWKILFEESRDPDLQKIMIDGTSIRAHACAGGYENNTQEIHALGRSKGGFTTKIHAAVDALGNLLRFMMTAGQRNEITQADNLTQGFQHSCLIADKAYDKDAFITDLESHGNTVVIPPRKNRKAQRYYDVDVYKERHLIECFFGKLKQFRRIFSRFDKCADTFLSFIYFGSILIWLR